MTEGNLTDLVEQTKAPFLKRLEELRPMVEEYNATQDIIDRLEGNSSRPRARAASTSTRRSPVRQGGRRDQVVEIVKARPGITITEMAEAMDIKDNYLYRVTGQLQEEGVIVKDGRGFLIAGEEAPAEPAKEPAKAKAKASAA